MAGKYKNIAVWENSFFIKTMGKDGKVPLGQPIVLREVEETEVDFRKNREKQSPPLPVDQSSPLDLEAGNLKL